jgi:hypothetical protein
MTILKKSDNEALFRAGMRLPAGTADFHFGGIIEIVRPEFDVMNDSEEKIVGIRVRIVDEIAPDIIGIIDKIVRARKNAIVKNLRSTRAIAPPAFDTDRCL